MNQSETRLRLMAKDILLDLLRRGEIPTGEKLALLLKMRTRDLDTSRPEIAQQDNQFAWGEVSSAKKMNKLTRTIAADVFVLYQTFLENEKAYLETLDKTLNEINQLGKKAQDLISRANRMLLVENRVEGLLEVFSEDFADGGRINYEETTAKVDLANGTILLPYNTERPVLFSEFLNLGSMQESDFQVTLLNRNSRRAPGTRDSELRDMLRDSNRPWMFTISSEVRESVSIEVKINLSRSIVPSGGLLTVKKISLDPFIIGGSVLHLMQFSEDGISWKDLPVEEPSRRLASPTIYLVEDMVFRFIRLILTKDSHDRLDQVGRYVYDFGINSIRFESVASDYLMTAQFESTVLRSLNEFGEPNDIRMANLSLACESVEVGTEIDYDIIFVDSEGIESEAKRVIPLNRGALTGSKIAEYSAANSASNESRISSEVATFLGSDSSRNKLLTNSIENGPLQIWRNRGKKDRYYLIKDKLGVFREDGWKFEEGLYQTFIWVDEAGGQEMDFGPYQIVIDNTPITGRVRLSEGLHHCKVQESRWYSLEGLSGISGFDRLTGEFIGNTVSYGSALTLDDAPIVTQAERKIDTLYPHNHKLILEGLDYSLNFQDTAVKQRYKGCLFAAHFPYFIADNEFTTSIQDYNYDTFSKVKVSDGDDGVETRIMVKSISTNEEPSREDFLVIERSNGLAKGLKLRATLRTRNPKRSPSFDGYQIRIIN
jgi:hypothetical protein